MLKSKTIKILMVLIVFISSCKKNVNTQDDSSDYTHKFTILYTNDEHGWIEKSTYTNGAANMMTLWKEKEGYDNDESFLILSGGDNWTGPAISTWFEGKSTVEVMNAMEYDASAIGNHEFDFEVEGLNNRIAEADFVFLAANIRVKSSGQVPDFATPYIIKDIDDVLVGIIGLSNIDTPWTTFPTHVEDYEFIDYYSALNEYVPIVKEEGAEIVIVIGHICNSEITALANTLIDLGVSVVTGGHCRGDLSGRLISNSKGQVAAIKASDYFTGYMVVEIEYNKTDQEVKDLKIEGVTNDETTPDPTILDIVNYWRDQTDAELSEVIGYTDVEITRSSNQMHNMVTDSWLYKYPNADIVMTNAGGIRQSIPNGEITKEVIIGVLPFQNNIIELELTGSEIIQCAQYQDMIFGGMTIINGYFLSDGTEINENISYHVLTTDYLYSRSDQPFSSFDPTPYYTGMNYSQPSMDYIESFNTSATDPLNNYLDGTARR